MTTRYCPRCRAEVENAEGFCLLGHPLRFDAPRDSLSHLRAEVDRVFADAKVEVGVASNGARETSTSPAQAPPPPGPPQTVYETIPQPSSVSDPLVEFAPAPRMDWGPERQFFKRR